MVQHFLQLGVLFQALTAAFAGSLVLYLVALLTRKRVVMAAGAVVFGIGVVLATLVMADRYIEAGRAPFKTLYESLILFVWCTGLIYALLERRYPMPILGLLVSGVQLGILAYAVARVDVEIVNLPAALQSGWFVPHVVIYLGGYGALLCGGVAALVFLVKPQRLMTFRRRSGDVQLSYGQIMHRLNVLGFFFISLGLITGALWAKTAWGDYWSWDPKENWSLITWFVYLIYLHLRLLPDWTERRAALVSLAGLGAVFFTYLGMSLLPTAQQSVHVYQG